MDINMQQSLEEKQKWEKEKVEWIVDKDDFTLIAKIASGGQGDVFKCKQISTDRNVVMKRTKGNLKDQDNKRYFNREIQILAKNNHPAIVPFIGYNEQTEKNKQLGCIYLEMIEKGTLASNISANNKEGTKDPLWNETHKFIISYGIACAMEYLHHNNIIHRDLKPENVLIDSKLQPYVTDFGTAKNHVTGNSIHQTIKGTTLKIMAPEFLIDFKSSKNHLSLDVYSFGITLYHLWTGIEPFSSLNSYKITKAVIAGERPEFPDGMQPNIMSLIEKCWNQEQELRPTFTQIVDILLSDEFANENTISEFQQYKEKLDPYRPASKTTSENLPKNAGTEITLKTNFNHSEPAIKKPKIKKLYPHTSPLESPVIQNLIDDAKKGNLSSELKLALFLYRGTYCEVDKEAALKHFTSVANKTDKNTDQNIAEYYAGIIYKEKEKYDEAERLLRRAFHHGNGDAAFTLAELISSQKIRSRDFQLLSLYKFAADKGEIVKIDAIRKLISLYLNGNNKTSNADGKKMAYDYIAKGSYFGDPEMMYKYSKILEYGMGGVKKNVEEAMKLLEILEFRYLPSQVDFALHLLNGYNIQKNKERAETILEEATNKEDQYATLYYSMIISQYENCQKEVSKYLEICQNKYQLPEAWVVYGQKLIESGQYIEATEPLIYGMQAGSINAFILFGNICENNPDYGDKLFFFRYAANRCHAMQPSTFYFPFKFNVYRCLTCGVKICEGCAKSCHKDHDVQLITSELGCNFRCECQINKNSAPKCTAEFIAGCDHKIQEHNMLYQHLYQCETCCPNSENVYICKECAKKCHSGHKIIDCGIQRGVCSCGLGNIPNNFKCSLMNSLSNVDENECSAILNAEQKIYQRMFQCFTCSLYGYDDMGVCLKCAQNCHKDHRYVDFGFGKFNCVCFRQKCKYYK